MKLVFDIVFISLFIITFIIFMIACMSKRKINNLILLFAMLNFVSIVGCIYLSMPKTYKVENKIEYAEILGFQDSKDAEFELTVEDSLFYHNVEVQNNENYYLTILIQNENNLIKTYEFLAFDVKNEYIQFYITDKDTAYMEIITPIYYTKSVFLNILIEDTHAEHEVYKVYIPKDCIVYDNQINGN